MNAHICMCCGALSPEPSEGSLSLRLWREEAGYTQPAVARAVGVSARTYWRWEHGETMPDWSMRRRLLEVVLGRVEVGGGSARPQYHPDQRRAIEDLKAWRKTWGVSQVELASILSVRRQAVSRWERGASLPTLKTSRKLIAIREAS